MTTPTDTGAAAAGADPPARKAARKAASAENAGPAEKAAPARKAAPTKRALPAATEAEVAAGELVPARKALPAGSGPARSGSGSGGGHRGGAAGHHHRRAARQAVERNSTHLEFSVGDTQVSVTLPPLDKLAYYAGLAGAAAFGLVEWPVALLAGVGHLLSDDRNNRTLQALGEALDAAA